METTKPGLGLFRRIMGALLSTAAMSALLGGGLSAPVPVRKMQYVADKTRQRRNSRAGAGRRQGSKPKEGNNRQMLRGGAKRHYCGARYTYGERLDLRREAERRAKAAEQ